MKFSAALVLVFCLTNDVHASSLTGTYVGGRFEDTCKDPKGQVPEEIPETALEGGLATYLIPEHHEWFDISQITITEASDKNSLTIETSLLWGVDRATSPPHSIHNRTISVGRKNHDDDPQNWREESKWMNLTASPGFQTNDTLYPDDVEAGARLKKQINTTEFTLDNGGNLVVHQKLVSKGSFLFLIPLRVVTAEMTCVFKRIK